MFPRFFGAALLAAVACGVAVGDGYVAFISIVASGKVTFQTLAETKKKHGLRSSTTLPVAKDVKVLRSKGGKGGKLDPGPELPGGIDNEELKEELKKVQVVAREFINFAVASYIITD